MLIVFKQKRTNIGNDDKRTIRAGTILERHISEAKNHYYVVEIRSFTNGLAVFINYRSAPFNTRS
jgi:hypothetical protein